MAEKAAAVRAAADKKSLKDVFIQYVVVFAVVLLAIYTAIVSPQFLTLDNLKNLLGQLGPLGVASVGMTFIIISGYFDLSIVGIFSLSSIVSISALSTMGEIPAILLGLAVGAGAGFVEALVLAFCGARNGADSTFVTYGIGLACSALALIYTGGSSIRLVEEGPVIKFIGWGTIGFVPVSFLLFLIVMLLANLFMMHTKPGAELRMMGGNREATKLVGVQNDRITVLVFMILGFMAALGGIISFARTTSAAPGCGYGYDSNTILAVVIGGTRLSGGVGSVLRTTIGVVLVAVLQNALNLIGLSTFMCEVIKGIFLIFAIWLDYRRK